jgi:hypothetical protein
VKGESLLCRDSKGKSQGGWKGGTQVRMYLDYPTSLICLSGFR